MKRWSKIILFGDSLTQWSFDPDVGCWGALLANRMQRVADVVCRGFSGYNTSFCKIILPEILKEFNAKEVAVFTLWLGANDANSPSTRQHVSLGDYKANLSDILNIVTNSGIETSKVIVICPPAYCCEKYEAYCASAAKDKPCLDNAVTAKYAEACLEAVKPLGVDCVNLHAEMMKCDNWQTMLSDGLHLSRGGAQFVYDKIIPLVEAKVLKHRGSLDLSYPPHAEIDPVNPAKSLS